MKIPRHLFGATFVYFCVVAFAWGDGSSSFPQALLSLTNTWAKAQTFSGLDVTGQQQGLQGTNDGCHYTYSAGIGYIACVLAGVSWRPLNIDSSVEYHGLQNPTQNVAFLGAGGFTVVNEPITFGKLSAAPGTAAGASRGSLFLVPGTNTGTCKLQIIAGTSTAPVTIQDNIGSGC